MDFMCRKCGATTFYLKQSGMQVGMYCDCCGSWGKWIGKKDINVYKNRGHRIYGQNMEVQLKGTPIIPTNTNMSSNQNNGDMGFETVNIGTQNIDNTPIMTSPNSFGMQPQTVANSVDMENEIERRVAERLAKISKQELLNKQLENNEVTEGYCSVCDGNPMEADSDAKVEVSVMDGVLMITDINGCNIMGVYKIDRCPKCGRKFKKE